MSLAQIFANIEDHQAIDIQLWGKLALEGSQHNLKGIWQVFYDTLFLHGSTTLRISSDNFGTRFNEHIFWLPWRYRSIESITWTELNDSKCTVALTSEFTGCRLTITNRGIAHVSYEQPEGCGQLARDLAEGRNFVTRGRTVVRRSMSDIGKHYGAYGGGSCMIAVFYRTEPFSKKWIIKEISYGPVEENTPRRMRRYTYVLSSSACCKKR